MGRLATAAEVPKTGGRRSLGHPWTKPRGGTQPGVLEEAHVAASRGEEEKVWESEGLAGCGPAEAGCIWPRSHLETLLTSDC